MKGVKGTRHPKRHRIFIMPMILQILSMFGNVTKIVVNVATPAPCLADDGLGHLLNFLVSSAGKPSYRSKPRFIAISSVLWARVDNVPPLSVFQAVLLACPLGVLLSCILVYL
jgi:hypothetical protein